MKKERRRREGEEEDEPPLDVLARFATDTLHV